MTMLLPPQPEVAEKVRAFLRESGYTEADLLALRGDAAEPPRQGNLAVFLAQVEAPSTLNPAGPARVVIAGRGAAPAASFDCHSSVRRSPGHQSVEMVTANTSMAVCRWYQHVGRQNAAGLRRRGDGFCSCQDS